MTFCAFKCQVGTGQSISVGELTWAVVVTFLKRQVYTFALLNPKPLTVKVELPTAEACVGWMLQNPSVTIKYPSMLSVVLTLEPFDSAMSKVAAYVAE